MKHTRCKRRVKMVKQTRCKRRVKMLKHTRCKRRVKMVKQCLQTIKKKNRKEKKRQKIQKRHVLVEERQHNYQTWIQIVKWMHRVERRQHTSYERCEDYHFILSLSYINGWTVASPSITRDDSKRTLTYHH